VNKVWSIVFGVVMLACGLLFVVAPFVGWWLPEGVSTHAHLVDGLFYGILYVTGFFFFLTEAILVVFMYKYAGTGTPKPARSSGWPRLLQPLQHVLHDTHHVEMAWTLVPAIILLVIAFAQIGTWAEVKYRSNMPEFGRKTTDGKYAAPLQMDLSARQFEWRFRYPHPDRLRQWFDQKDLDPRGEGHNRVEEDFKSFSRRPQYDDVHVVNELHTWKEQPTVVYLSTRDVIHSFNIPVMRVKQDALPGKTIPVWFVPSKANTALDTKTKSYVDQRPDGGATDDPSYRWDLPCAELCGWGHYRMIGRVYVHDSYEGFLGWLDQAAQEALARSGPR